MRQEDDMGRKQAEELQHGEEEEEEEEEEGEEDGYEKYLRFL